MKRDNRIKKCQQMVYKTRTEEETLQLGKEMAAGLKGGDVVLLHGGLGAGKSVFTRGIARGLGISGPVTSPTFTILKIYQGRMPLYHIDAYRLEGTVQDLGFEELMEDEGLTVIEWSEYVSWLIPEEYMKVTISLLEEDSRRFVFEAHGEQYEKLLEVIA